MDKPQDHFARDARARILLSSLVCALALSFALFTRHAWEDWYITYRVSKNLATGNGPVYTPGEKIHVFTSPLGFLAPALLNMLTRNSSDDLVLWLFRLLGCAMLGGTAFLLLKTRPCAFAPRAPALFLAVMLGSAVPLVDFSINGMETAFMALFLALSFYAMSLPDHRAFRLTGLAWAGLLWTRPDSFVYIAGLAAGWLLFNPVPGQNRGRSLKTWLKASAVCLILYAPWLLWSWHYYGSPIPNTITAKSLPLTLAGIGPLCAAWKQQLLHSSQPLGLSSLEAVFMPPYYFYGGWNAVISAAGTLLALFCAFYWIFPAAAAHARAVSFALLAGHVYLSYLHPFIYPWYVPPLTLLSIMVLAMALQHILDFSSAPGAWRAAAGKTACSFFLLVALGNVLLLATAAWQLRLQQEIIEYGQRRNIGLWLKDHAASPRDSVFLEPLGYIGFFSGLKMFDNTGLASKEVVGIIKKNRSNMPARLIAELRPDWLVLRPFEISAVSSELPSLLKDDYEAVKTFDARAKIASHPFLPGRQYLQYDQIFVVFRAKK